MAGGARTHLAIGGIFNITACVPGNNINNPLGIFKGGFHAPETSSGKGGNLVLIIGGMPGHGKTKDPSQDKETQRGCHINSICNNDYYINIQSVKKLATILQWSGMKKSVLCEFLLKIPSRPETVVTPKDQERERANERR
jgi:hypothetical protein